jgi:hypothetical protein
LARRHRTTLTVRLAANRGLILSNMIKVERN